MTRKTRPKYLLQQDLVQDLIDDAEPWTFTLASLVQAARLSYQQAHLATYALRQQNRIIAIKRKGVLHFAPKP